MKIKYFSSLPTKEHLSQIEECKKIGALIENKFKKILPNFLIPGANKSGTSFVAKILNAHKDIFMSYSKEPSFFSTHPKFGQYHRGMDFYCKNFVGYNGESVVGEASTVYMYDPESPKLIKENIGEIPLVFILRDPIDRVYSNYWQSIKGGINLPDFSTFIDSNTHFAKELILVSRYDLHIQRYLEYFSRAKMHFELFDDLKTNPREVFNRICDFLGVTPLSDSVDFTTKVNPSSVPRSKILARALKYRPFIQTIKQLIPEEWGPKLRKELLKVRNVIQKPYKYPEMDQKSKKYLVDHLFNGIEQLEKVIEKDLSLWKKRYLEDYNSN